MMSEPEITPRQKTLLALLILCDKAIELEAERYFPTTFPNLQRKRAAAEYLTSVLFPET